MEFISPTHGRLSFDRMFQHLVGYMQEQPEQRYHLIIGTDSLLGDDTCFVTAVVIHRVGRGGRYFYHKFRNRKIESLRQRILYETSLSLETASQLSAELAKNGRQRAAASRSTSTSATAARRSASSARSSGWCRAAGTPR